MVDVTVVKSESGELIKMGPIEIRVLEDGRNTDNRIGSVVLKIGPKTKGVGLSLPRFPTKLIDMYFKPILHWHRMHDETFLITKGKVRFHTDKGDHDTAAGDYVVVPPKSIHSFSNPFDEPAEFFNTFTPAYYVDYLVCCPSFLASLVCDEWGGLGFEG
jgi:quercetin dioxygenase-like cupin family protein